MHCQKSLKGPGTVLNGFPSKQAYKIYHLDLGLRNDDDNNNNRKIVPIKHTEKEDKQRKEGEVSRDPESHEKIDEK